MENRDEWCRDLLESTRRMLRAVEQDDPETIGRTIAERQQLLDRLSADKGPPFTAAQEAVLAQVMELDGRARRGTAALMEKKRAEIRQTSLRFDSQMKYKRSGYGLSSGMVMDKKR